MSWQKRWISYPMPDSVIELVENTWKEQLTHKGTAIIQ